MTKHISQLSLADAPRPDSPSFEDWAETWTERFDQVGTFEAEADKAARRVRQAPTSPSGWWWKDQLPAIVSAIEEDRSTNPARPEPASFAPQTREEAEKLSRGCGYCQGGGWATVYHRLHDGRSSTTEVVNSDGSTSRVATRFALACICPLGRWLVEANRRSASNPKLGHHEAEQQRKVADRMAWIGAVVDGRAADYTLDDPSAAVAADEARATV